MRALTRLSAVGLIALAAIAACKKQDDDASAAAAAKPVAPPVKVPLAAATEQPTPEVVVLTGTIAANQRAEVTADTQGKVINVMVQRGDRVKLGQAVVSLDVRNAALSQREAAANLSAAQVQRQNAEDECKRAKALFDKGAITKSDWDKQNTACLAALDQVTAAEARTQMTAKSVSDGIVRAPFDGLVGEKDVSPGEWVNPGKALFTLVDDNPLHIDLSVPEVAVSAVHKDEAVSIIAVAYPDKVYNATVTRVGAEIGPSRSLVVEARLDPGSPLVPGMFAEAHIIVGQKPHVVVPSTAVVLRGKISHVYVVVGGELQDHIVQVGEPPGPGLATILQGVNKGDKVVTTVDDKIVDGLKVVE